MGERGRCGWCDSGPQNGRERIPLALVLLAITCLLNFRSVVAVADLGPLDRSLEAITKKSLQNYVSHSEFTCVANLAYAA